MEPRVLRVRMLGEFTLAWGDVEVKDTSSRAYKVWLFLAYLIYNRPRAIPREEQLKLLGTGERDSDPARMLRNVRWSARKLVEPIVEQLGQELILSKGSDCVWNPDVALELDAEEFEARCVAAEGTGDPAQRLMEYRAALALYQGDFLKRLGGELWVEQLSAYFHNRYLYAAEESVPLLQATGEYQEAAALCRTVLADAPYQESLHRQLMVSLMGAGDYAGAGEAYRTLREMLLSELGILPDEETQAIYRTVAQQLGSQSMSPDAIRAQLREQALPTGALICDYPTFRLFYQVEARSADRRGDAIHIGVLSVVGKGGKSLSNRSLNKAMEQLSVQIQKTLRIGDVAACCSASQYILLLVQANFENSQLVCRRVVKAFAQAHPRSPAQVQLSVLPLEPLFGSGTTTRDW